MKSFDASDVRVVGRFDESRKAGTAQRWLVERPDGSRVTVSHSVKALVELCQQGCTDREISEHVGKPEGVVRESLLQIEEILSREQARRADSFWFRATLIPARWVQSASSALRVLYRPLIALALVSVSLVIVATYLWTASRDLGDPNNLLVGALLFFASLIGHEFGHAAACAAMGAKPSSIGLTVYLIYPAFFSDVSDAWRLSRAGRCIVDVGGLYFQAICMAVLVVCYWLTEYEPLRLACWLNLASLSFSLNPLLKMDAYWILSDALGVANLSDTRRRIVSNVGAWMLRRPVASSPWPWWVGLIVVVYAALSTVFLVGLTITLVPRLQGLAISTMGSLSAAYDAGFAGDYSGAAGSVWSAILSGAFVVFGLAFALRVGKSTFRWLRLRFPQSTTENS